MRNRTLSACVALCMFAAAAAVAAPKEKEKEKPKDKNTIDVTIKDLGFNPETVTIKVGQTVRWTNKDDRDYTLMAKDRSFQSGNLRPKETFDFKFEKAGTFDYIDLLRPRVAGSVVVEAAK